MNTRLQTQVKVVHKPSFTPMRDGLLQRKCACGGNPGVDGGCTECREKRLRTRNSKMKQHEHSSMISNSYNSSQLPMHSSVPQTIQPKLTVNLPGDKYEQEAEQVAEQVMRMPPEVSQSEVSLRPPMKGEERGNT